MIFNFLCLFQQNYMYLGSSMYCNNGAKAMQPLIYLLDLKVGEYNHQKTKIYLFGLLHPGTCTAIILQENLCLSAWMRQSRTNSSSLGLPLCFHSFLVIVHLWWATKLFEISIQRPAKYSSH